MVDPLSKITKEAPRFPQNHSRETLSPNPAVRLLLPPYPVAAAELPIAGNHSSEPQDGESDDDSHPYHDFFSVLSKPKDVFTFLPLPCVPEEFKIDINWKYQRQNKLEPPPYVYIKRNMYLFKRKRQNVGIDTGCTSCSSTQCFEACV